ncbi:hypothetical protein L596_022104 [Steinernema carpocapsae]|uniref:G-protein coupled receptors family 1 profile domain-containing protein n=1 Tax=Steinernema carpocapsae TaxID=34508 RepID=A0A4U5MLK9_STECR|nr:hypothetical protein L596_022104 [Steinernema carpocapsae]
MVDDYEHLYNRVLDVTACIHIPVKLFSMIIVARSTTPEQFHYSVLILNLMFWNFLANILFAFIHLYPTWPAECFRLGGPLSNFIDNEYFGHFMFAAVMLCILNTALAMVSTFPYRYFVFAHSKLVSMVKPRWIYLASTLLWLIIDLFLVSALLMWNVSYDSYPETLERPDRTFVFCFSPKGPWKLVPILGVLTMIIVLITIIVTFSFFLLKALYSKKANSSTKTLQMQKKAFWTLVTLTSIMIILAAIPMVIAIMTALFPHLPYAKPVCLVCIVFISNHGTVYSIATITLIQSHREMAVRIFKKVRNLMSGDKKNIPIRLFVKVARHK